MVSAIERLRELEKEKGVKFSTGGRTTDYGLTEEEASEMLRINQCMDDPINAQIARLEGQIFLKSDTINCLEKRVGILPGGFPEPIPPTPAERMNISRLKEDIDILRDTINLLKDLQSNG